MSALLAPRVQYDEYGQPVPDPLALAKAEGRKDPLLLAAALENMSARDPRMRVQKDPRLQRQPLESVMEPQPDRTDKLATLLAPLPGIGDVAGLAADVRRYATDPESRTPGNFAMSAAGLLPFIPNMTVWHGSPHKFPATQKNPLGEFDINKIGTGEGAQAYGHGLYVAENPGVAKDYRASLSGRSGLDSLHATSKSGEELSSAEAIRAAYFKPGRVVPGYAGKDRVIAYNPGQYGENYKPWSVTVESVEDQFGRKPGYYDAKPRTHGTEPKAESVEKLLGEEGYQFKRGSLYKVDLPDEHIERMLDWDLPLNKQPQSVQDGLRRLIPADSDLWDKNGKEFMYKYGTGEDTSKMLHQEGIPGIRYFDAASRIPNKYSMDELKEGLARSKSKEDIDFFKKQIAEYQKETRNFVVFDDQLLKILDRE